MLVLYVYVGVEDLGVVHLVSIYICIFRNPSAIFISSEVIGVTYISYTYL